MSSKHAQPRAIFNGLYRQSHARRFVQRTLVVVASVFLLLLWAKPSHAYPWMIQHQYTGCALCHLDPSGGYLLTTYGRAQTQALLSTFGSVKEGGEVDSRSNFAFGLMPPNDWVNLGASVRESYVKSSSIVNGPILMQADFRAAVTAGPLIATGSVGYLQHGQHAAQITKGDKGVLVSREFWLGVQLGEDKNTMIRAGRMYLPFGIRVIEHPFYVRQMTGTNIDSQQQYGAAFFHDGETYHMEIMGIAGNYQIAPDEYRQRGYAGYVEVGVHPGAQLGFSSMVTYTKLDPNNYKNSAFTGAHGPMLRWSPFDSVALLAEFDLTHYAANQTLTQYGLVGMSQIDWEVFRGLHTMVTGEIYHRPELDDSRGHHFNNKDWLSLVWFMYPHIDVRGDAYWASEEFTPPTRLTSWATMGTLHVSL
jgi:hypothetical protein